jgi:ABC-type branched-subunit amino acid transport system substrate-binding protein/cytochrome c553
MGRRKLNPSTPQDPAEVRTGNGSLTGTRRIRLLALASLITMASPLLSATPEESDSAEARGAKIYTGGVSASGRLIRAQLQWGAPPAAATSVPCISCHGPEGTGDDEAITAGGMAPPDITWQALTSTRQHQHGQRVHVPFDENLLIRAITRGIDPSGNPLDAAMPRYTMADEDLADLIAYLRQLETEQDPGLSEDRIRIGTVLPLEGPLAEVGQSMRGVLEAMFTDINRRGGIHGRFLELAVASYGGTDDPVIWSGRDLIRNESPFALVSGFLPGFDDDYAAFAGEFQIPLIGPYTVLPPSTDGNNRHGLYLLPGLAGQSRALVRAAMGTSGLRQPRLAIVYPLVQHFDRLADAIAREAVSLGLEPPELAPFALNEFDGAALARMLHEAGTDAVVFLCRADEFIAFGQAADSMDWEPRLLAPASLVEHRVFDLPVGFSDSVLLAYPSLPTDYTEAGQADFERLHADYTLDYAHSAAQIAAFTATRLLFEGLERAGSAPSRKRLLAALEGLREFEPGLTPPLSYGPDRRMGSLGAHVVGIDLEAGRFRLGDTWITIDPENDLSGDR